MYTEDEAETEAGAYLVLNFWANLRLAVLIRVVLIKKACIREIRENKSCLVYI